MTDADKPSFAMAFNRLVLALREPAPDAATLRAYFDALAELEIEFILAAVPQLLKAEWFPKSGEWWRVATTIKAERVREQRQRMMLSPSAWCLECGDTGWRTVQLVHRGKPERRVERCPCQEQRYRELLGHVEMPALPPAPNVEPADDDAIQKIRAMLKPIVEAKTL